MDQLVARGKEQGYVLYDDVTEMLPGDLGTGGELDDLLAGLDRAGIDILEEPKLEFEKKSDDSEDLLDLELPAG
ncbi:MAG: RNA polymerase sigma factor region1.1 domain-containing protein, partial [Acidobacteriota bacterium]|nr:RNA polymerase sigma factor region1.1 domain-containing protein [Acidobacteriota bacterium]